ncbi:hypothetical protein U8335_11370 [Roseiconus lacunae]|uniref:hypothetical protein n=1 Tax=Roseiconus lacunae TaxID=2605694 RepID=UPI00308542ED|nr:hypothetical protein U8335_11370 [Stieleria sp. HD01]
MNQEDYRRHETACHESGHAVVAFVIDGIDGETVLHGAGGGSYIAKRWEGISPIAAVAGFVASAMYRQIEPIDCPREILNQWKANEFVINADSTTRIDEGMVKEASPIEVSGSDEVIVPSLVMPSDSDKERLPQCWRERAELATRAFWLLRDHEWMFLYYVDCLLNRGEVGIGVLPQYQSGIILAYSELPTVAKNAAQAAVAFHQLYRD